LAFVMPGLVPGIHVFRKRAMKTWLAGVAAPVRQWGEQARP
jgi:hypothetical protein